MPAECARLLGSVEGLPAESWKPMRELGIDNLMAKETAAETDMEGEDTPQATVDHQKVCNFVGTFMSYRLILSVIQNLLNLSVTFLVELQLQQMFTDKLLSQVPSCNFS